MDWLHFVDYHITSLVDHWPWTIYDSLGIGYIR